MPKPAYLRALPPSTKPRAREPKTPRTTAEYRAMLAANETEDEIQTRVINRAHELGWLVMHSRPMQGPDGEWKTPLQGDPGFVDLVLARDGRALFIELKSARGHASPEQRDWLNNLPPEWTMLARPADFPRIEELLQ